MTLHTFCEGALLGVVVLASWLGALGAWRMREPMQSLHFCTLPATLGMGALTAALFLAHGNSAASWKTALITLILLTINSVGMHASGRAFRARQLGHWEPREGDAFTWVQPTPDEDKQRAGAE